MHAHILLAVKSKDMVKMHNVIFEELLVDLTEFMLVYMDILCMII
jgi:hypothetical protein